MPHAALGFRAHSGWAVMVATVGTQRSPIVAHRARIEMVTGTGFRARQPYHAAAELDLNAAEKFIAASKASATRQAEKAIRERVARLKEDGFKIADGGILLASGRTLPALDRILAAHPLIHAAEGELFRQALIEACARCGLTLAGIREREIMGIAAKKLRCDEQELAGRLAEMGRSAGRPWRQDEKLATLAGWLVLP